MKLGRHPERKERWLQAFPGVQKFLNQCVVCQATGYDPAKINTKRGAGFQKHLREFFQPLELNASGICPDCVRRGQTGS